MYLKLIGDYFKLIEFRPFLSKFRLDLYILFILKQDDTNRSMSDLVLSKEVSFINKYLIEQQYHEDYEQFRSAFF